MERYRSDQILRVAVPQWHRANDGRWTRDWSVRLADRPNAEARRNLHDLSEEGIQVVAEVDNDGHTLHLRTTTDRDAFSDEIYFVAAYRMLRRIDENVGRIESIQGQPREWWQPFRDAGHVPSSST